MTNLATLIGIKNLQNLLNDKTNTHCVVETFLGLQLQKLNDNTDVSKIIYIGTIEACNLFIYYINNIKNITNKWKK